MDLESVLAVLGVFAALASLAAAGFSFLWSEKKDLDARLRRIEEDHVFLRRSG